MNKFNTSSSLQTLGTVSTPISASNPNRVSLIIQVKSGGKVTLKVDAPITLNTGGYTDGLDIVDTLILDFFCPQGSLHMLASVPNTVVFVQEIIRDGNL